MPTTEPRLVQTRSLSAPHAAQVGRVLLLSSLALVMLLPFFWMILASFKPLQEVENLNPLPEHWRPNNYTTVLGQSPDERTGKVLPIAFEIGRAHV